MIRKGETKTNLRRFLLEKSFGSIFGIVEGIDHVVENPISFIVFVIILTLGLKNKYLSLSND